MFRRITSKRATRIVGWIFITLVTFSVLLWVWTNWSGKRRWAATKAMIDHEGETLDFRKLLPETPPKAENLLAIDPLRGIAEVIDNDESKGEPGAKRKALESLKWSPSNPTPPATEGVSMGKTTDFQAWVAYLRDSKLLDLPAGSEISGRAVLTALDAKLPLLKQLSDRTAQCPKAMFVPGLREREMPALLLTLRMPHYTVAQNLARLLSLRARAAVEARDSVEATRGILAIEGLAKACKEEPLLIGFLVGASLDALALEPLWLGLREHAFAEEGLQQLQGMLSRSAIQEPLLQAMRGELTAGLNSIEYLQSNADGQRSADAGVTKTLSDSGIRMKAWRLLPGGLFDHWKSVMGDMEMRYLILPLKNSGLLGAVRARGLAEAEIKQHSNLLRHPDHIMANLMLPAVSSISAHALLAEARRSQALAAVALERFFAKHARHPASLEEAVPEFLPAVPLDPCDGKALRYQVTGTGRGMLWSVGFDGKSNGGEVRKGIPIKSPDYLGDWAWQYDPVK